ncbi:hypothetical protein [Fodinicurvata sp. EGI_FJ10296]|uniref:hypothetical protein n=1 Tax=Fodinicurvata sp. EGI_FJ10296 TaxID=3231908 RepID=UPI003454C96E
MALQTGHTARNDDLMGLEVTITPLSRIGLSLQTVFAAGTGEFNFRQSVTTVHAFKRCTDEKQNDRLCCGRHFFSEQRGDCPDDDAG